jgi:hypothetical protein
MSPCLVPSILHFAIAYMMIPCDKTARNTETLHCPDNNILQGVTQLSSRYLGTPEYPTVRLYTEKLEAWVVSYDTINILICISESGRRIQTEDPERR